jgi:hypothetical protein
MHRVDGEYIDLRCELLKVKSGGPFRFAGNLKPDCHFMFRAGLAKQYH